MASRTRIANEAWEALFRAQATVQRELLVAQAAGHRLRDVAAVPPADRALRVRPGVGEADSARAPVVGVLDALDESGRFEPGDQSRDAGLGQQDVAAQLGDAQAVRCVGQGVEHAVLARAELIPDLGGGELPRDRGLGAEQRLPRLVRDAGAAGHGRRRTTCLLYTSPSPRDS